MKFPPLFFCTLVLLLSCRKDPPFLAVSPDPAIPVEANLVSTPGSWWKYEWYTINSVGNVIPNGMTDSLYVAGDSVINGNTYIHYSGTYFGFPTNYFRRDSSGCILNQSGVILYNYNSSNAIYTLDMGDSHTWWNTVRLFQPLVVPAGAFYVYDRQVHHYNPDGTAYTPCDDEWIRHEYYADGIGIIASQNAYVTELEVACVYREQRLVDYYIAP